MKNRLLPVMILCAVGALGFGFLQIPDRQSPPPPAPSLAPGIVDGEWEPDQHYRDWAEFFGLDPECAETAMRDDDGDGLNNWQESRIGTDPFVRDTARNGWADHPDKAPLSRAYIDWGSERFSFDDEYIYPRPAWSLGAWKVGGIWLRQEVAVDGEGGADGEADALITSSWYVHPDDQEEAGLWLLLDRELLTSDLALEIEYWDEPGSDWRVGLSDADGNVLVADLFGNLAEGSDTAQRKRLDLPLERYPAASWIHVRRLSGGMNVYESLLYVDRDGDGLDEEQEEVLGTSDLLWDSDGDGLSDWEEAFVYGTDPLRADTIGDGIPDGWAVRHGLNPLDHAMATANPAGDGMSNLEKYRRGLDPRQAIRSDIDNRLRLRVASPLE